MEQYYEEPGRRVPVAGEYDVIVAGGGIAGIAAALAAVRHGAKTLLIEKQYALGGLATLGLVTIYLPICDGCGRQVSFGLAEELLRLSIVHGHELALPEEWLDPAHHTDEERKKNRYKVSFNAHVFAITAEQKLIEEGCDILYGTSICAASVNGHRVEGLITENKSGRAIYLAGSVVDCTGDADIFHLAGAKTVEFSQGNILAAWYYATENGRYDLHPIGCCDVPDKDKGSRPATTLLVDRRFTGLDGKELSDMTVLSHGKLLEHFLKNGEVSNTHALSTIATIPQIRMTRRPEGIYTLDDTDDHVYFEDSVGMISNWKKPGPIYEVPFRSLYGPDLDNVIAAGRCIANTDTMWDITRVIPCCSVTGQAAGTAAAMSRRFSSLDVSALQKALTDDGVKLHIADLG